MLSSKDQVQLTEFLKAAQTWEKTLTSMEGMVQDSKAKQLLGYMLTKSKEHYQTISKHLNTGQKGSQGQQTESGGQRTQLSDHDALKLTVKEIKNFAGVIHTSILETRSEGLRRDYMTILGDTYSQHKQLRDYMEEKGFIA